MNLALKAEAVNEVKPLVVEKEHKPVTHEEIVESLNIGFVREFAQTQLNKEVLDELVFALDLLKDITRTPNYPQNRLLNTEDIITTGSAAVCVFNDFAKRAHEPSMYGCAVGAETADLVKEFMETGYLRVLATVVKHFKRESLMLTLDNESVQISLKRFSPHPEFGLLTYNNYNEETVVMFPFHLVRLDDA
jgi:hypothetical protein